MQKYDKIEKQIKKILEAMLHEDEISSWSNPKWTKEIKRRICKLGKEMEFYVCASTCNEKTDWEEWLYDVIWLKLDKDKYIVYSPLAMECEWGDIQDIRNDFEKLLLARTKHRIMIFQGMKKKGDVLKIIENLKDEVSKFEGSQPGDRYLFAGYDNNTDRFEFDLLVI